MNVDILMSLVACSVAIVALIESVAAIIRKLEAERRFLVVLTSESASGELRRLWDEIMQDGVASKIELQELVASLGQMSERLSVEDRMQIDQGLRQRSMLGRARYVAKLMNKAGVGVGPLPVALS
jgi:hypothetical protein